VIVALDETGFSNQNHKGKSYAPRGKTPVKFIESKRARVNLIVSLSLTGQRCYKMFTGYFNAKVFISFLRQLTRSIKAPILLFLDKHPVHLAKAVKQFCLRKGIELVFFPSYSPELNPVEYWNNDKKSKVNRKSFYSSDSMKLEIKQSIKNENKSTSSNYFKTPYTSFF
jgi:transposase